LPIDALSMRLRHLQAAEFLYETPLAPDLIYTFKHALTHEVAYQSLLKSTRQHYHQRVAQVLAACFPEAAETQSELLAHHYTKAGLAEQAVEYWQRAGEHSHARSAYAEAIRHFTKGLELLKSLPDSPERTQQELTLRLALGVPLMATKGFATPDVEKTYVRAQELCQQAGETSRLFSVLSGLWACYEVRGQLETVRELAGQLLTLAERLQDPALILESHRVLGDTLYLLEEFAPARMHLEQGMALYDPQQHRTHAFLYGCDPGVFCTPLLA
jgi:tetratricopeptide (TPR) repeat protein